MVQEGEEEEEWCRKEVENMSNIQSNIYLCAGQPPRGAEGEPTANESPSRPSPCYRYIWGNRNRQPLREMHDRHSNMEDVRTRLGVKSIRCRIEKRVLERIGHVLRMGNDRITKAVVLGWWEELEGREKKVVKKRKTVLYLKRLLREAGIDWTDIERIVGDRDGYRELVRERVGHIEKWDRQKGHKIRMGRRGRKYR